jgi:hypothetical protein
VDAAKKKKDEGTDKKIREKKVLKVYLEYGLEDSYEFTVISELEMEGTSAPFQLPTFNTMVGSSNAHTFSHSLFHFSSHSPFLFFFFFFQTK